MPLTDEQKKMLEPILEAITNFGNAMEAAGVDLKHRTAELLGVHSAPMTPLAPEIHPVKDVIDIQRSLPSDIADLLNFEIAPNNICRIRPKQFLGAETFSKVAAILKGIGGQYISAGKDSRFEVSLAK